MVHLTIDGFPVEVEQGATVLEAARKIGVRIPTLCHLQGINESSSCRVCVVEAGPKLIASCTLKAENGMNIMTNTKKVRDARKTAVELLLSDHRRECTSCARNHNCELQTVSDELNIRQVRYIGERNMADIDISSRSIVRDPQKCILCGRCVGACREQTVNAIGFVGRGFTARIAAPYEKAMDLTVCINCGQCTTACPTGALTKRENIEDVWEAIYNPSKFVVVQTAPAVRVALGEAFGLPIGTRVTGKMVAALRRIGFDRVFDTDFAADLTIMEEGAELLHRLQSGERLPLMTSCCPGWVKFMEHFYPELLDHLSTCKSPHEMEGAIIKSYFAKSMEIDPEQIVVVSVMPCTAKKFESGREELAHEGRHDVDFVLTTRELAVMIKQAGLDFPRLQDEAFDNPFGAASGAGVIFGATGGVAEAALRTVFELVAGTDLETIDFTAVRGMEGIKAATVELPNGRVVRTAVAHGLGNARKLLDSIRDGLVQVDFIEVMACPGGCVTGGGQPIVSSFVRSQIDVKAVRAKAIYDEDQSLPIRKSHKNPDIQKLYADFLGEPNSHLSHELLHTHYVKRSRF